MLGRAHAYRSCFLGCLCGSTTISTVTSERYVAACCELHYSHGMSRDRGAPGVRSSPVNSEEGNRTCLAIRGFIAAFLRAATRLINERGYAGPFVRPDRGRVENVTKGSFYHISMPTGRSGFRVFPPAAYAVCHSAQNGSPNKSAANAGRRLVRQHLRLYSTSSSRGECHCASSELRLCAILPLCHVVDRRFASQWRFASQGTFSDGHRAQGSIRPRSILDR